MVMLRSFDAFPKVDAPYRSHPARTSPLTYLYLLVCLFFLYSQTTSMMGDTEKQTFDVDSDIKERFQINLEMVVKSPCDNLNVFIKDINDDRLSVNEIIRMIPSDDPETDGEQCMLSGVFETTRITGRLLIQSRTAGVVLSHYIQELSFGEYYPSIRNPSDMTEHSFDKPSTSNYNSKIVPTTLQAFGIELETYQYSTGEIHNPIEGFGAFASIQFDYNFEAIKVTIRDNRMPFLEWLCRVMNIFGGVLFAARAFARFFLKKWYGNAESTRYSSGLSGGDDEIKKPSL